jgi:hypothetical protein
LVVIKLFLCLNQLFGIGGVPNTLKTFRMGAWVSDDPCFKWSHVRGKPYGAAIRNSRCVSKFRRSLTLATSWLRGAFSHQVGQFDNARSRVSVKSKGFKATFIEGGDTNKSSGARGFFAFVSGCGRANGTIPAVLLLSPL